MVDDPKVMTLRPALRWRFIESLLIAGELDEDGYLPDLESYSWRVRDNAEVVETEFVELLDAGLLSRDDTRFFVTKFAERQEANSSTDRWRRWKKRQQKQEYYEDDAEHQRKPNETFDRRDKDKEEDKDKTGDGGHLFELYEKEIGLLTPHIGDQIGDWIDTYSLKWIEDAIKIAAENNKRKTSYINGILKNWHTEGRDSKKKPKIDTELERQGYVRH